MKLIEKQFIFSRMTVLLFKKIHELGYEFTYGETWRPEITALAYAKKKIGIKRSLHQDRLAIDINLFKNGIWLQKTEEHRPVGLFWESLSTKDYKCCWGGRFNDGNHYSIEHEGRK